MIWEISLLIMSIAVLLLVTFLIPTVLQTRRTARKVEEVSNALNYQLPGILTNLDEITTNLSNILSNGRQQMEVLGEAVEDVKDVVSDFVKFEKNLKSQIEDPIIETLTTLTAITRGLRAFFVTLRQPR